MTSDGPKYRYHCSCGAAIDTSAQKEVCSDCGNSIEVLGVSTTPKGEKYSLRISKEKPKAIQKPSAWVPPPNWDLDLQPRLQPPDSNKRYAYLGLMILLAPIYVPLLLSSMEYMASRIYNDQPAANANVIKMPKPTDCGLFSGCHYEERVSRDSHTGKTVFTWERIQD
jgi:hypothetical protein